MMIMEEEEEMSTATTTAFLPQEIVMEILSRLPANSLVSSFKFVCKTWCNLIKDPDFVKMHLNRVAINGDGEGIYSNNNSLICKSGNELFQLYPPFNFEGILPTTTEAPKKLDFDFDLSSALSISRLVGSCNGLLCLKCVNDDNKNIILLINPSTRRYKISLIQPIEYPKGFSRSGNTFGLGCCYNPTTNIDEYKVVRIVDFVGPSYHGGSSYRSQVDVYCMSSNSWRTDTRDYAFTISNKQSGVFVNEALHWVTASLGGGHWDTIASFDIRDEEFRQVHIPLPCEPPYDEPYFNLARVILMNMKGCLSMIRFSDGRRRNVKEEAADLEIWVMKEYGIKESWTKEFVIRSWDTDPPRAISDIVIASWISNANVLKGDQILMERLVVLKKGCQSSPERFRKLILYDINKRKINGDFKMIGVPDQVDPRLDQVEYIETLVSLKSSVMVHALESNLSSSSS